MNKFAGVFVLILTLAVVALFLLNQLSDREAVRLRALAAAVEAGGRAEAMVIRAQGQSRLDSAQAIAPILAVIVLGLFGFAGLVLIATLGIVFVSYLFKIREYRQPPQQVIYILPRGSHYPMLTDRPGYFLAERSEDYVSRQKR